MRLTWKINLALSVSFTCMLAVQARGRLHRELALFEAEMARDHRVMGRALRNAIEDEIEDSGPDAARALVSRLDARHEGIRIRYVDLGAHSSAASPDDDDTEADHRPAIDPSRLSALRLEQTAVEVDREADPGWFYTYLPLEIPGTDAALEIRESLAAQRDYVASTRRRVLEWFVTLVAALWLMVAVLVRVLVGRPVERLIAHGQRVARGDFASRAEVGGGDELGELARELDAMAEQLAGARDRVAAEQAARERALDQLRHADRLMSVGKLAAGVAHELGTPLNVVLLRANAIADWDPPEVEAARTAARRIADQCQRMAGILRQLMDFARPRALSMARHELRGLTASALGLLAPLARARGVRVALADGAPLVALVDAGQVQQVLLNLVTNALHATPAGGSVTVEIERVRTEPPPASEVQHSRDWARIVVADTGAGIAPEHLTHVFEPFFTTKDVGEGTGLGLSISHGIARDHGGWIEVDSQLGEWTRFALYLRPESEAGPVSSGSEEPNVEADRTLPRPGLGR